MDFTRLPTIWLIGCLLLVSCSSEPDKTNQPQNSDNKQDDSLSKDSVSAEFICAHLLVKADFYGENLTLIIEDKSYQLSQTSSGSGSKFENKSNNIMFWQKGDSAILEFNDSNSNCQKVTVQRSDRTSDQLKLPFTARGNEPGWLLNINKSQLELITDYGKDTTTSSFASQPLIKIGQSIQLETPDDKLSLLVEDKLCHDSMSGMPYPYTVSIQTKQKILNGCGGEPRSLLTESNWTVLSVADNLLIQDSKISLNFNAQMELGGVASCNRYATTYSLSGEGISISPITTTLMACEPPLMKQEANFLKHLANITRFDITNYGQLILVTSQGETIKAAPDNQ